MGLGRVGAGARAGDGDGGCWGWGSGLGLGQIFLKENPSENLALSNRPCLLSVFAMDNTAAQRFDSTKFSDRKSFRKFGAIEPPLFVAIIFNG